MLQLSGLSELQRKFGPVAERRRRPEGSFRTARCEHGFRCDPEPQRFAEWLCPVCRCPWETPKIGSVRPGKHAHTVLVALVTGEGALNNKSRNVLNQLESLEAAGLVVGIHPTPAGVAYVSGRDFWGEP